MFYSLIYSFFNLLRICYVSDISRDWGKVTGKIPKNDYASTCKIAMYILNCIVLRNKEEQSYASEKMEDII